MMGIQAEKLPGVREFASQGTPIPKRRLTPALYRVIAKPCRNHQGGINLGSVILVNDTLNHAENNVSYVQHGCLA